jgi:hypothetical protein
MLDITKESREDKIWFIVHEKLAERGALCGKERDYWRDRLTAKYNIMSLEYIDSIFKEYLK